MQRLHRPTGAPRALDHHQVQVPQQRQAQEEVGGVAAQHQQHRQRPERERAEDGQRALDHAGQRGAAGTHAHQREQDDDLVQRVRALAEEQAQRAPGQTAEDRLPQRDAAPDGAAPAQPAAAAQIEPGQRQARGHHQLGHQHPGRQGQTRHRVADHQTDGRGHDHAGAERQRRLLVVHVDQAALPGVVGLGRVRCAAHDAGAEARLSLAGHRPWRRKLEPAAGRSGPGRRSAQRVSSRSMPRSDIRWPGLAVSSSTPLMRRSSRGLRRARQITRSASQGWRLTLLARS